MGPLPRGPREEAVQGAGMVESFPAQGAAESDASVRLGVRSHVPGTRRDRAQAEEAGIRKAKPPIEMPSVGIRLWAVFQRGSAHEPQPLVRDLHCERLCPSQAVGILGSTGVGSPLATPWNRPCPGFGGWTWKRQKSIAASEARTPNRCVEFPRKNSATVSTMACS